MLKFGGRSVALDVRLAVSDLATNALTHGSSTEVELALDVTADEIILTVDHCDGGIGPDPVTPQFPAPTVRSGRGLAIVHSIATSVTASMLGIRSSRTSSGTDASGCPRSVRRCRSGRCQAATDRRGGIRFEAGDSRAAFAASS